ncbi:MAG: ABC transporter permease [Cyclobacteriaceae bacterium]
MSAPIPPKWPFWILSKVCSDRQLEILYGDAIEIFQRRVMTKGVGKARLLFIRDTLSSIKYFSLKWSGNQRSLASTLAIYKNYLKLTLRSFSKNRLATNINFFGLVVGFFAALLIAQYAIYEMNYDHFHEDYDRTYRVSFKRVQNNQIAFHGATTFLPVGPTLLEEFPEVYNQSRFYYPFAHGVFNDREKAHHIEKPVFVDETFFEVFSFKLLEGDSESALAQPNSVVLSETLAKKFFGSKDALGRQLRFSFEDGAAELIVTGVMQNRRSDSHLQLDVLMSMKTLRQWPTFKSSEWSLPFFHTYIQLKDGTNPQVFENKSGVILEKFRKENIGDGISESFILQPLQDIHLDSHLTFELEENGNRQAINFLILIAILILVIVYLNFINLTTALSSLHAKEVGIRKVMGSHRKQLIPRFLIEALVMNVIAFLIASVAVVLSLDYITALTGIYFELTTDLSLWSMFFGVVMLGAVISTLYPTIVLTAYEPITVLRGKFSLGDKGSLLRRILISTQFAITVAMIGGMILISQQTDFLLTKDLGFKSEQLLVISAPQEVSENGDYLSSLRSFENGALNRASIHSFTSSSSVPGKVLSSGTIGGVGDKNEEEVSLYFNSVSYGYFETYGLTFLSGRPFSRSVLSDQQGIILNHAALQSLGYGENDNVIGEKIIDRGTEFEIIGIVNNYHHSSLKTSYEPIIFVLRPARPLYLSLNVSTSNLEITLEELAREMKLHFPADPFEYFFLDQVFDQEFKAELRYGDLLKGFSFLAVILAALGLFGLSSFLITQRTKEIGIRKVLGATPANLFSFLSSFFLVPMVSGGFLACAGLYYFGSIWLRSFPFRIELQWLVFLAPLATVLLMTGITMVVQTIKAQRILPAETLKNE